jgi:DNA-binding NtrC family response regulator
MIDMKPQKNNGMQIVLIADDDKSLCAMLKHHVELVGYSTLIVHDGNEVLESISEDISVVLLDLNMPGMGGLECLRIIRERFPDIQVVIVTASNQISDAVESMKSGAFDYITKPINIEPFYSVVHRAVRTAGLSTENRQLKNVIGSSKPNTSFIGKSPVIKKILSQVENISTLDSTVFISGESGVGKGLLARLIHYSSSRSSKPLVTVVCTALPRDLVESELFGHERGAFTGANNKRMGLVEVADGGTLFLDEIGDMPIELQPKVLSFLQERCFYRVGGNKPIHVDVRVIAVTNQNIPDLFKEKRFREDLYYRVNVLPFHIPPLRERQGDIPILVKYLLDKISQRRNLPPYTVEEDSLQRLVHYRWPGNVRELENVLERTTAFCTDCVIKSSDLPHYILNVSEEEEAESIRLGGFSMSEIEKMAIEQTLEKCGGNRAKTSRMLGISEKSIYNKMKAFGLK